MGYYTDSDSEDYVNLACKPTVLSSEEEERVRAEVAAEVEELRAEMEARVATSEKDVAKSRLAYEDKLYKEAAFVGFNDDAEWRNLQEQNYVDRKYASVWLGYWAELRSAEDVRRVLRVGGDVVKAWMERIVAKVQAMPHFEAMRKGVEKMEVLVADDRAYIAKRCEHYRESRLSFHGLR